MATAKQITVTLTRLSDKKVIEKTFKTKKAMRQFLSNNFTTYTW